MKTMLCSLTESVSDSWDTALPWVLFAYREVPVEMLGCSPFHLLSGLASRNWFGSAKRTVVEFILDTRERLRNALNVANKQHAQQERTKAKKWYDRRACLRSLEPGDKVLVLSPIPGQPLQAKFPGPYVVEQQPGPVDYVISTPVIF